MLLHVSVYDHHQGAFIRRFPDDGRRPKYVGASQRDFNVNFKTLPSLIKSAFVGV